MNPNQPNNAAQPSGNTGQTSQPFFKEPYNSPVSPVVISPAQPPTPEENKPEGVSKKVVIAIATGAGFIILILLIVVIVLAGSSKSNTPDQTKTSTSNASQAPQAATGTGLQQTTDSISQDLSTVNDDQDLPANKLDDKTLNL